MKVKKVRGLNENRSAVYPLSLSIQWTNDCSHLTRHLSSFLLCSTFSRICSQNCHKSNIWCKRTGGGKSQTVSKDIIWIWEWFLTNIFDYEIENVLRNTKVIECRTFLFILKVIYCISFRNHLYFIVNLNFTVVTITAFVWKQI